MEFETCGGYTEVRKLYYEKIPESVKLEKIETTFDVAGGSKRDEPAADVSPKGYVRTNREGAEEWHAFFDEMGIDPLQPWVTLSASKSLGTVFMYAATGTEEGKVAVKFFETTGIYTTHFGAAFKQCPSVAPLTKVEARFKPSLDQEGRKCIAVIIKGAPPKRKGAADVEELAARAEAEAAKKAAKAAARKRITDAKNGTAAVKPPTEEQQ